jgi:hypothetical protein
MLLQKSSAADHTDWRLQMNTNLSTPTGRICLEPTQQARYQFQQPTRTSFSG